MYYKEIYPILNQVVGFKHSLIAMRKPKMSKNDSVFVGDSVSILGESDKRLAMALIKGGNDHAKAFRGIIAYLTIKMQTGFMIEFETYRHGVECLSTSSAMHGELKGLKGTELAEKKQKDLCDKVYERDLTISYQALRSMYKARRTHRHPDWQIFCDFVETLPWFNIFIMPEKYDWKEML